MRDRQGEFWVRPSFCPLFDARLEAVEAPGILAQTLGDGLGFRERLVTLRGSRVFGRVAVDARDRNQMNRCAILRSCARHRALNDLETELRLDGLTHLLHRELCEPLRAEREAVPFARRPGAKVPIRDRVAMLGVSSHELAESFRVRLSLSVDVVRERERLFAASGWPRAARAHREPSRVVVPDDDVNTTALFFGRRLRAVKDVKAVAGLDDSRSLARLQRRERVENMSPRRQLSCSIAAE